MPLAAPEIDFLRELIADRSGNVIASHQTYLLEQRLKPVATDLGLQDVSGLVSELRRSRNSALSDKVAEAVTVNETSFFRDMHLFQALQQDILPKVFEKNRATKKLRIWCAASSTGQEPYSLAMTIAQHFPHFMGWNIQILATDICENALNICRQAEYRQLEVNRGLPAPYLVRFFDRQGSLWRVKKELRDMIKFQKLNLMKRLPPMDTFDLVLIRNVLIYFDNKDKVDIVQRINSVLARDGYLFIGSAETFVGLNLSFKREEVRGTICYRP